MNELPILFAANFSFGSGRLLPGVAAAAGVVGVVLGGAALARARRASHARSSVVSAAALGLTSFVIGLLHAANSAGGFGTGNGLAGALVAMALGLTAVVLAGMAVARSRRLKPQ